MSTLTLQDAIAIIHTTLLESGMTIADLEKELSETVEHCLNRIEYETPDEVWETMKILNREKWKTLLELTETK